MSHKWNFTNRNIDVNTSHVICFIQKSLIHLKISIFKILWFLSTNPGIFSLRRQLMLTCCIDMISESSNRQWPKLLCCMLCLWMMLWFMPWFEAETHWSLTVKKQLSGRWQMVSVVDSRYGGWQLSHRRDRISNSFLFNFFPLCFRWLQGCMCVSCWQSCVRAVWGSPSPLSRWMRASAPSLLLLKVWLACSKLVH